MSGPTHRPVQTWPWGSLFQLLTRITRVHSRTARPGDRQPARGLPSARWWRPPRPPGASRGPANARPHTREAHGAGAVAELRGSRAPGAVCLAGRSPGGGQAAGAGSRAASGAAVRGRCPGLDRIRASFVFEPTSGSRGPRGGFAGRGADPTPHPPGPGPTPAAAALRHSQKLHLLATLDYYLPLRTMLIVGSNHLISQTGWPRCNPPPAWPACWHSFSVILCTCVYSAHVCEALSTQPHSLFLS